MEWKYTDSPLKKKVSGSADSKKIHAENILGDEKTHYFLFSWKGCIR